MIDHQLIISPPFLSFSFAGVPWSLFYLSPSEQKCVGISGVCQVFATWPAIRRTHTCASNWLVHGWINICIIMSLLSLKGNEDPFAYLGTANVPANNPVYVVHCAAVHKYVYSNHLTITCDCKTCSKRQKQYIEFISLLCKVHRRYAATSEYHG